MRRRLLSDIIDEAEVEEVAAEEYEEYVAGLSESEVEASDGEEDAEEALEEALEEGPEDVLTGEEPEVSNQEEVSEGDEESQESEEV